MRGILFPGALGRAVHELLAELNNAVAPFVPIALQWALVVLGFALLLRAIRAAAGGKKGGRK
jgi:hypothetical protein